MEQEFLPNLKKGDLRCLCKANEEALNEATQIILPHLKPNLTKKELAILKKDLLAQQRGYRLRWVPAKGNIKYFENKNESWLELPVRVPACLLNIMADESVPDTVMKCANCHKHLEEDLLSDKLSDQVKIAEAFQVVFEGLLTANNKKVSNDTTFILPELCSNCDSLLISLHKMYIEFMNATESGSPVQILLGESILWKIPTIPAPGKLKPEVVKTRAGLWAGTVSDKKRKRLKTLKTVPVKTRKSNPVGHPENSKSKNAFLIQTERHFLADDDDDNFNMNTDNNESANQSDDFSNTLASDDDFSNLIVVPSSVRSTGPRRSTRARTKVKRETDAEDLDASEDEPIDKGYKPVPKREPTDDYEPEEDETEDEDDGDEIYEDCVLPKGDEVDIQVPDNPDFNCPHCDKVCTSRKAYVRHVKLHSASEISCPYCGDLVLGTFYLKRHIRYVHANKKVDMREARPFVCPYQCPTAYRGATRARLKGHIKDSHPEFRKPFQCEECSSAFSEEYLLEKHKLSRHSTHPCQLCSKTFGTRSALQSHVRNMHLPVDESQLVECEICGKKCKNNSALKYHLLTHDPNRPREPECLCDLCGKGYATPTKLKAHVRVFHEGIKSYICPHCGIAFGVPSILKSHILAKHEPDGPGFPCPICEKVFKLKTYLEQHLRSKVHGGPGLHRSKQRTKAVAEKANLETQGHEEAVDQPETLSKVEFEMDMEPLMNSWVYVEHK